MNRRHFLQTGALSTLSIGLPVGVLSLNWKPSTDVFQWLRQVADKTGARRRSGWMIGSTALRTRLDAVNAEMARHGFHNEYAALYFYSVGLGYCFSPFVLRHGPSGLRELLVPVLSRLPNGEWQQIAALTGYHLEALARAAHALEATEHPLQEVLLPAGQSPARGSVYATARGEVRIRTELKYGVATTQIAVLSDGTEIYSDTFRSAHSLTTTATD